MITHILRILSQIPSFITINSDRPSNLEILRSKDHLFSNAKITRFEKTSFELTGINVSQNKTSIPKDSNSSKSKNVQIFTDVHVKTLLKTLVSLRY